MNRFARYAFLIAALTAPAAPAAEPQAAENKTPPTRVRLTLHPAAEPMPALKYRLLPTFFHERRGNAAPLYAKAMLYLGKTEDQDERRRQLLDGPLAECTPERVGPLVGRSITETVRLAAVREHCDWELPVHEQSFVSIMLPEIQEMRRLATIVALEGRAHVAARRYTEGVKSLETLYAMVRHTAQLDAINSLVGLAIQGMADKLVLEMSQQPGTPNLYWALAVLPHPIIDRSRGFAAEMHLLDFGWPAWNRMPEIVPSDSEISAFLDEYAKMMRVVASGPEQSEISKAAAVVLALFRVSGRRDEIRAYLERHGITKSRLDKLSDLQLAVLHMRLKFDEIRDDSFRWMELPYAQAKIGLHEATQRLRRAAATKEEILPCATVLVAAVYQVRVTHARGERRLDVLRLIEALRGYAAGHDGRLPKTLDELAAVTPVPSDAMTGKPLEYRVDAEGATLSLPEEFNGRDEPLVYEIRMAKVEDTRNDAAKK